MGVQDTGFRFAPGPGIPPEIVGKTAEEVAQEYAQLYNFALQNVTRQPGPNQAPQPPQHSQPGYPSHPSPNYGQNPYPSQPAPQAPAPPTPDEWQLDPAVAYQKQREYDEATRYQPIIGGLQSQVASTNMALLQQRYPSEFKKWGTEILNLTNTVPFENRSYDALERVIQIVRSNHIDDIVEEKWKEKMKEMPVEQTLRSGEAPHTGAAAPNSVDFNELPEGYRRYLEVNQVDQSTLDEFLTGPAGSLYGSNLNERRKGFVEAAKGGDVRTERPIQSDGGPVTADQTKLQISEA